MNFNFKSITFFLAIASMVFVSSCKDDPEFAAPVISDLEVGFGNSLTATIGSDLHMDADVVAEGLIDKIEIDMHNEDGIGEDIEAVFTNYSGQKNADFHEHIDIPATATPGEYHFHLKVVDQEGKTTEMDAELMVVEPSGTTPVIAHLEIGENDNHTGTIGGELHMDAEVVASKLIDKIKIKLHNEDGTGEHIEAEFTNYSGQGEAEFHEHIDIPASATPGEYHFHLEVVDQAGQVTEIDAEVMIQQ